MTDSLIGVKNVAIKIVCDNCGWKSELFPNNDAAFKAAQDHEDIEHEGSTIKWEYVH